MSNLLAVDGDNFIAEILDADRPVLLDCWATWCGPCLRLGPILEELASEEADRLKIVKLDTDDQPELAHLLGIQILPTMLLFVDGVVEASLQGLHPKEAILEHFGPWLKVRKSSGAGG